MSSRLVKTLACIAALSALGGCREAVSPQSPARAPTAEQPDISEIAITAGRFGVMLSQVRAILALPDPAHPAAQPALEADTTADRVAFAAYQRALETEFSEDAAAACARDVPPTAKTLACAQHGKPSVLADAADPPAAVLASRNYALSALIMPWWDTVCALTPQPAPGEPGACAIE